MRKALVTVFFAVSLWAQPPVLEGTPASLASLRYVDISMGSGTAYGAGRRLTVHYTGWLTDGKKFDSSVDRKEPFEFVQGRRQVITGWDVGFEGMKVGGKRRLFVPYQFAYGEAGSGPIPPKAELIFDVELLDVTEAKALSPAIDVLVPLAALEQRLISLAKAIPAEKYEWKPAPDARSVGEVIAHTNRALQTFADAITETGKVAALGEISGEAKEAAVEMLGVKFAAIQKEAAGARNGSLAADAELDGTATTRRGLFSALNVALAHDLGQLTAYAASLGIVLPWKPGSLD
jgi:peptidylprolyl isomerase